MGWKELEADDGGFGEEWLQVLGRMPESLETGTGKALGIEVVADEARLVVQLQEFD